MRFLNPGAGLARQMCTTSKELKMSPKIAFALLISMLPASLLAQPRSTVVHLRTQKFHDRTPKLHDRSAHTRTSATVNSNRS